MEYNNIFLLVVILFVFFCICNKIKKKKRITQKYGLTKIKNKDNVIEYYTNLPGENCAQITSEFVNQMMEKQELIRFNQQQGEPFDVINNLHMEIKTLHDTMKQECREQPKCRIKFFGPDDEGNTNNTVCTPNNPENINECSPAIVNGDRSSTTNQWQLPRSNGSRYIKYNKIVTDSWDNILISNKFMLENESISPEDFEYELNQPIYYVIRYDKDNFDDLFNRAPADRSHKLFNNNPTYKIVPPILNIVSDRVAFENGTITDTNNINRMKDILKILYMKQELNDIFTPDEINEINQDYIEEQEDSTIPAYIKGKYDEIIRRVNSFSNEETILTLKNLQANIIVESYKNIFDYCDFLLPETDIHSNEYTPRQIQKQIDKKEITNIEMLRNRCEDSNGEFIELMYDENNEDRKNQYCISRTGFVNPKNSYFYTYYDRSKGGELINSSDFETNEEFKHKVRESEIKSGRIERRKTGIKSGDRIFSLGFDDICKKCDKLFDGHGILGSIYDTVSNDYKVTSCVNSNDAVDENNKLIDPEIATKEFYTIDKNENFIKYTKVELEIDNEDSLISEADYFNSISTPTP